jgi:hypothetical protein
MQEDVIGYIQIIHILHIELEHPQILVSLDTKCLRCQEMTLCVCLCVCVCVCVCVCARTFPSFLQIGIFIIF